MLYKKNNTPKLDMELFKNPTSEYRGTPFWAWNCELNKDLLKRQIENLKKMGFGGFHMHSRAGMATDYLSDDFMELIKTCCDKAEEEEMLAWLYDEDRWPSGAAGGFVTKDKNGVKQVSESTFNDWCSGLLTKLVGKRIHPHILRESRATNLVVKDKKSVEVAQKLLGHESSETTIKHYIIRQDTEDADEAFI